METEYLRGFKNSTQSLSDFLTVADVYCMYMWQANPFLIANM